MYIQLTTRISKQLSTGYSPFKLDCGQHPLTPAELATKTTKVPAADNFAQHWDNMIQMAKDALMIAQDRQQQYANQHHRHITYQLGDKVLLSGQHINNPVNKYRPTRKLTPKFLGPYTINKVISTTAYQLDLPATLRIHPVFHVSLLKPYKESEDFTRATPPPPIIIPDTEEQEYEVETILDQHTIRGKQQYLVKWTGYPLHDATWEPAHYLKNTQ